MKNTKKSGIFHYRIFKWNRRYLGICREAGFVEESQDFEEVKKKLLNGTIAVLKAVITSSDNLEASLNTSPPFKYLLCYYFAPLLGTIEFIKDSSKNETSGFYSFSESLTKLKGLACA